MSLSSRVVPDLKSDSIAVLPALSPPSTARLISQEHGHPSTVLPSAQSFDLFPKLPAELRLRVWFHALPDPRIIYITSVRKLAWIRKKNLGSRIKKTPCIRARARSKIPVILHVCHDARMMALTRYQACLGDHLIHPVYVDYDRDILYFVGSQGLNSFFRHGQNQLNSPAENEAILESGNFEELKLVRFIAVESLSVFYGLHRYLQSFKSLRSLLMIKDTRNDDEPEVLHTRDNLFANRLHDDESLSENTNLELPTVMFATVEDMANGFKKIDNQLLRN